MEVRRSVALPRSKKYVFTAEGYQQPIPAQQRKGVSYWHPPEADKKQN